MRKFVAASILLLMAASTVVAQEGFREPTKNEIAVSIGHTFIEDQLVPNTNFFDNTVHYGKGWSFEGNYARALLNYRWGQISAEVPVIFNPDEDLNYGLNQVPKQYSSTFVTPSVRLNVLQDFPFSPWVSFGGGVARYVASTDLEFGGQNTGHRVKISGALQAGIGLDVKIPKVDIFRFRFEARKFWAGDPPVNVDTGHTRQSTYYIGGGAVFRF
jgi:hypothetical protein